MPPPSVRRAPASASPTSIAATAALLSRMIQSPGSGSKNRAGQPTRA